ncbi:hypothetical protein, partial [Shimia thalassica]|uniref:hypothetical protein n=1 Tax=Shimia thalassica TaxID=1715693 RepID=UPI0026E496C9
MNTISDLSLELSEASRALLNGTNEVDFTYNLVDFNYNRFASFDRFGVTADASLLIDIEVDYYASLTLPQTGFDAAVSLDNGGWYDQVLLTGSNIQLNTSRFSFGDVDTTSELDLSTLAFSTGFDVRATAIVQNIQIDPPFGESFHPAGLSIGTDGTENLEILGFNLGADQGENFTSSVEDVEDLLNEIPVDKIMSGTYAVTGVPLDFNWDFWALGFDETTQQVGTESLQTADFIAENGSGDNFLSAVLDLDDVVASALLPLLANPANPLLSLFEYNWSASFLEDTRFETDITLLATLLDLDVSIGVEFVQQTQFEQTGSTVTVSQDGAELASGEMGSRLDFAGLEQAGSGVYDVQYSLEGDLTTSYGFVFNIEVPVTLLDVAFWTDELEFEVDGHGFTEPAVPDDAFGFTAYSNTFRLAQTGFIPIPGMDSVTQVEFLSEIQQIEVEFVDDARIAMLSSDANTLVTPDEASATHYIIEGQGEAHGSGDDWLTVRFVDPQISGINPYILE